MPVKNLSARPPQEMAPCTGVGDIHSATNSLRSVILVGAGRRGLGAHLPALETCGYFRLTGIVDTKERIALLREIPALTAPMHDSLDPVLDGPRPDLAIVATPHDSHVPLAQRLLRAGIPTLLEKPPARCAPELATLLKLSEELKTPLATSLPLHYQNGYQRFIRLLGSPELTDAEVSISVGVTSWRGAGSWRLSRQRAGGGVLIDLGYHYLELLVACLGAPDDTSVRLTNALDTGCEVEGDAHVSLWFAERRVRVQLWLHSGPEDAKGSELSIRQGGALRYQNSAGGPARTAPGREQERGPLPPAPAAAQLEALVASGFLDGRGDWRHVLRRQHAVMMLLDDLYDGAACLPGCTDLARLPERTPA
jgi:predicted dehydrogenase